MKKYINKIKKIKNEYSKFPNKEIDYVLDVLDKTTDVNYVDKLESEFSRLYGVKYSIACNSGTSALHASLAAIDLKPGDEVIIPALTVVMDAYAAIHVGATPIFADVDKETFLVNDKTIEKKISAKTKAVMLVSLQGLPVDIDPIIKLSKKHNFYII